MGYQNFTVGTSEDAGIRRNVEVFVYDTIDEMRDAAYEFTGIRFNEAAAVTHAVLDDPDRLLAAIVRLVADGLGTRVITHEMAHAAQTIYCLEAVPDYDARAVDHFQTNNETFAYLLGDLCADVVDGLYDLGYYHSRAETVAVIELEDVL